MSSDEEISYDAVAARGGSLLPPVAPELTGEAGGIGRDRVEADAQGLEGFLERI
jgi:hypothetical protein